MTETLPPSYLLVKNQKKRKRTEKHGKHNQETKYIQYAWALFSSHASDPPCMVLAWGHLLSSVVPEAVPARAAPSALFPPDLAKLGAAPAGTEESSTRQYQRREGTFTHWQLNSQGEAGIGQQGQLLSSSLLKTKGWGTGGWRALAGALLCTFSWLMMVKKEEHG